MGQITMDELTSMRREGSEHGLSRRETMRMLEHVDALTAEVARLRGKLDALVTACEERERRGFLALDPLMRALEAARGGE